jgi:hypothetical protein
LSLALRHPNDEVSVAATSSPPLALSQLFGVPMVQRLRSMEVYRGAQREVLTFGSPPEPRLPSSQIGTPVPAEQN